MCKYEKLYNEWMNYKMQWYLKDKQFDSNKNIVG